MDFTKAFDRIDHNLVMEVLFSSGFGEPSTILALVSVVSSRQGWTVELVKAYYPRILESPTFKIIQKINYYFLSNTDVGLINVYSNSFICTYYLENIFFFKIKK